ncbi:MAG: hypothetical protein IT334_10235, partial [Thermomicrobiales bacterium]|nr:hypothetical protein [Thermomicrobiales bacterium]
MQQAIESMNSAGKAKTTRLTLAYVVFAATSIVLYYLAQGQVQSYFYDFFGFFAVACIIFGIWWHRPEWPLPWALIATGIFVLKIGDLVYAHHEAIFSQP